MSHTTYEQRTALGAGIAQTLLDGVGMRASTRAIYDACHGQGVAGITTDLIDDRLREMRGYGDIIVAEGPLDSGETSIDDVPWYEVTVSGYSKLWYTLDDYRRGKVVR
jgi:hypothetical protein